MWNLPAFFQTNLKTHCKTGNDFILCLHLLCFSCSKHSAFFKLTLFLIRYMWYLPAFFKTNLETHCKAGNYVIRCLHSLCILCNENTAFVDWLCFWYAARVLCLRFAQLPWNTLSRHLIYTLPVFSLFFVQSNTVFCKLTLFLIRCTWKVPAFCKIEFPLMHDTLLNIDGVDKRCKTRKCTASNIFLHTVK